MNKREKILHLDEYLKNKYEISISDVLKINQEDFKKELENDEINEKNLKIISNLFFLDLDTLIDESKELPKDDLIQVDEVLISSLKDSYLNNVHKKKNKNIIKRNYHILNQKNRKKLWISLFALLIPFLAITIYSFTTIVTDVVDTLNTYKNGEELTEEEIKIKDSLPSQDENGIHYASIKIGAQMERINHISASDKTYQATMILRFDFDQEEYHEMFYQKYKNEEFNADNFYTSEDLLQDNYCFNSTNDGFLKYKDNIPDIFQFNFKENTHLKDAGDPISISTLYLEEIKNYPGEKQSNVFPDKNDEFFIGNGKITPDTIEYLDKGTPYYDETSKSYRYFQSIHFTADINKTFDSPRYPLDSVQFKIFIQPNKNTNYIRYIPDLEMSGLSTYFSIGDSYRLIKENNKYKNYVLKLNYYEDTDLDSSSDTFNQLIYKTQLEIILRANKNDFSVYANNFLNIVAIAIWLILAFFNLSYNKEDSISMIGTGFFSAISAILLGFSIVSQSNIFSLLSIINIYTLIMVLVMGYESIQSRSLINSKDPQILAFRTIKIRILFYLLVVMSIVMYVVLPFVSYLWIL